MQTITVYELLRELTKFPSDAKVEVWLPGSRIALGRPFLHGDGVLLMEGNVKAGSALDMTVDEIKNSNTPEARLAWDRLQARAPVFQPCHCGLMDASCTCKSE